MNDDMNNGFNRESTNNEATNTVKSEVVQSSVEKKKLPILPIIIVGVLIIGAIFFVVLSNNKSGKEETNNGSNSSDNSSNSNNSSSSIEKKNNVSTDWKEFEFSINGVKFQLPLTVDELLQALPEGWEVGNYEYGGNTNIDVTRLDYNGSDKSVDPYMILLYRNEVTEKIFHISVMFDDSDDKSTFEINGINGISKEKDVKDILGIPAPDSIGKYVDRYSEKNWHYTYYINGTDTNEGWLALYGDNNYLKMITLVDTLDSPESFRS